MSAAPNGQLVSIEPDSKTLAALVAEKLAYAISDAVQSRGECHVALTGGGIGTASLVALLDEQETYTLDWARVDFWWSDERFEPSGSELRNETGARSALLDHLRLDPDRIHPMPASDGPWGDDVDAAAAAYAAELTSVMRGTAFDVALLGVGPDGHVASIFPELPELMAAEGIAIPVRHSPKPPPTRISLTLPAISQSREVWLIAAGAEKAPALREALYPANSLSEVSAGRVFGTEATLALLDQSAASELP